MGVYVIFLPSFSARNSCKQSLVLLTFFRYCKLREAAESRLRRLSKTPENKKESRSLVGKMKEMNWVYISIDIA